MSRDIFTSNFTDILGDNKNKEDLSSIWSSTTVKDAYDKIEVGIEPKPSPFFFKRDNGWRKGDIVYEYTKEEIEELTKCANDVLYFSANYVHLLNPEGYTKINPRKYQRRMLSTYEKERNVIVLSARQVGKCITFTSKIRIKENDIIRTISIGEYYYENLKKTKKLSLLDRFKLFLYRLI